MLAEGESRPFGCILSLSFEWLGTDCLHQEEMMLTIDDPDQAAEEGGWPQ